MYSTTAAIHFGGIHPDQWNLIFSKMSLHYGRLAEVKKT